MFRAERGEVHGGGRVLFGEPGGGNRLEKCSEAPSLHYHPEHVALWELLCLSWNKCFSTKAPFRRQENECVYECGPSHGAAATKLDGRQTWSWDYMRTARTGRGSTGSTGPVWGCRLDWKSQIWREFCGKTNKKVLSSQKGQNSLSNQNQTKLCLCSRPQRDRLIKAFKTAHAHDDDLILCMHKVKKNSFAAKCWMKSTFFIF